MAPSGEGTVVLDIGGDTGAVVIHCPASLDGAESSPPGRLELDGTHTAVRRHDLRDRTCFAAVFGAVGGGATNCGSGSSDTEPQLESVGGGRAISEAAWPTG